MALIVLYMALTVLHMALTVLQMAVTVLHMALTVLHMASTVLYMCHIRSTAGGTEGEEGGAGDRLAEPRPRRHCR